MTNLIGTRHYCPMVRLTDSLKDSMSTGLEREARSIVDETEPLILARAVSFLSTRKTKSSFAIEGEVPGKSRASRFAAALEHAAEFNPFEKKTSSSSRIRSLIRVFRKQTGGESKTTLGKRCGIIANRYTSFVQSRRM